MSDLLTLQQAGIPYPDMSMIESIDTRLGGGNRFPEIFYGGWLRDLVNLGHTNDTGDIDVAMTIGDFLALKPTGPETDIRRHFILHEPHLLFMLHQSQDIVFEANSKPFVLALKTEHQAEWGLDRPVGLTLTRQQMSPFDFAGDNDLGFDGIASDGREIWVTQAFLKDYKNKTITLQRCHNPRDYERTQRRIERFTKGRYTGWTYVVPEELQHLAA